jgi:hypothetical protein
VQGLQKVLSRQRSPPTSLSWVRWPMEISFARHQFPADIRPSPLRSLTTLGRRMTPIGALTPRPMTMLRAALNATSSERAKKLPKAPDDLRWLLDRADALAEDVQRDQQVSRSPRRSANPASKGPDLAGFAPPLGILPRRDWRGSWRLASNCMDGPRWSARGHRALAPRPSGRAKGQSAKLSPLRTFASLDVAAV